MDIISHSESETIEIARELSTDIKGNDLILLHGDLGMGKSVFARALIRKLTGDQNLEVPSPTFTLVQTYDTPHGQLHHFDLYRLEDPEEIYELGWEDFLHNSIIIIEWPERLGHLKPKTHIDIHFTNVENNPTARRIQINKTEA